MEISPEERKRRSERAKQLVASGKIGGPRPNSGRPRKKRASEIVADKAREEADLIVDAFLQTLKDDDVPKHVKVSTAEKWLNVESKEASLRMEEERHLERMTREQLTDEVVRLLEGAAAQGALNLDAIDGMGEEIEPLEELGDGSEHA